MRKHWKKREIIRDSVKNTIHLYARNTIARAHGVEKTANYYEDDGWQVKANIDKWDSPESILGHIPDIIAKKGKDTVIIQINTCISLLDRMYQESTLEAYAQRTQNTRYMLLIVDRDMTIKTDKEFNEKYLG